MGDTTDQASATGVLVLVTGTGRSGTSTVSGTLHHLGLNVPGPYLGANRSNPKGFFESKWAVQFHKRLTALARINDFDGRPTAFGRAQEAITPELREELAGFLVEQAAAGPQLVVKDPRSVWAQQMWREAAAQAGLEIRYLSMLRHPAEVVGSRATYYASKAVESQRRRYEIFNIGRWVNNSLVSERETRGGVRTFVPYNDVLADWRSTMRRVRDELGLTYNTDLDPDTHHPVDDFVDPDLRRVRVTWQDLDVPADLQELAQGIWDDLMVLCAHHGADDDASRDLDRRSAAYDRMFTDAVAISHDAIEEATETARREGAREARAAMAKRRRRAGRKGPAPKALEDRALRDVTARELLEVLSSRGMRRLRRR